MNIWNYKYVTLTCQAICQTSYKTVQQIMVKVTFKTNNSLK